MHSHCVRSNSLEPMRGQSYLVQRVGDCCCSNKWRASIQLCLLLSGPLCTTDLEIVCVAQHTLLCLYSPHQCGPTFRTWAIIHSLGEEKFEKKNLGIFPKSSFNPSAIYSYSIEPLSVLHSKLEFEWQPIFSTFFNFFKLKKKKIIKAILCNFSMRLLKCF